MTTATDSTLKLSFSEIDRPCLKRISPSLSPRGPAAQRISRRQSPL
jgi:hypothetical protein